MTEQIVEGLLKWLISVMNRDKFLMDHKLLSRDKKASYRLKNLMEPLLRYTGVKIAIK